MLLVAALWGCDPEILQDVAVVESTMRSALLRLTLTKPERKFSEGSLGFVITVHTDNRYIHLDARPTLGLAIVQIHAEDDTSSTEALDHIQTIFDNKECKFEFHEQ